MKYIIIIIFLFTFNSYSQGEKEVVYLLFDNNSLEKCTLEDGNGNKLKVNVYRKELRNDNTIFNICEEIFFLDKRYQIDTCSLEYLKKIKFETLKTIEYKRKHSKYVFKNSVFKKIYLVEKQKNKIIKYPVIWNTDMIEK